MRKHIRWLLLIPATVAAWYGALFLGLGLHGLLFSLCPPELAAYGFICEATWFDPAERALIGICAGVSAALVVFTAAAVAPSHRVEVAWAALAVGMAMAAYIGVRTGFYGAFASACLAGMVAVALVLPVARRGQGEHGDAA